MTLSADSMFGRVEDAITLVQKQSRSGVRARSGGLSALSPAIAH